MPSTTPTDKLELPYQGDDPCSVPHAITTLARRIVDDLTKDAERFDADTVDSFFVAAADLLGRIPAVTPFDPTTGLSVVLVDSSQSPIQQLRALLAEVEAGLSRPRS